MTGRNLAVLLLTALAAGAVGYLLRTPGASTSAPAGVAAPAPTAAADLAAASAEIERLKSEIATLRRDKAELEAAAAAAGHAEERGALAAGDEEVPAEGHEAPLPDADEKAKALAEMEEIAYRLDADWGNLELLESYVVASMNAGVPEAAVEKLEALAKAHPDDPNLAVGLGRAYLTATRTAKNAMEQGRLAMTAIEKFDRALALDETHIEARLNRAVTNYHMPPFLKRLDTSITDLEKLVEQSGGRASDDRYAAAYAWLTRAYRKAGRGEEAEKTLAKGRELFPANPDLERVGQVK